MRLPHVPWRALLLAVFGVEAACAPPPEHRGVKAGSGEPTTLTSPRPSAMPHPAPQNRPSGATSNAECESCHLEVADEWQSSLHAEAFTGREFSHAFRLEPLPFCRQCHAPEAGPRPDDDAEALGVACITCHLVDDVVVLAGPAKPTSLGEPAETPPHPVRRDARFASPEACAGCHEFPFPGTREPVELMQTTVTEHRQSAHADRSCADCHMPKRADGGRSHAFLASRDGDWMRSVVDVHATRTGPGEVVISLKLDTEAVGHALPTGDLFRRISVEAISTRKQLRPTTVRHILARHWALLKDATPVGPANYTGVFDDRLGVGDNPRIVHLTLDPLDAALPVRWRVRYERVESMLGGTEEGAIVVGGVILARGMLEPPSVTGSAVDGAARDDSPSAR